MLNKVAVLQDTTMANVNEMPEMVGLLGSISCVEN